MFDLDLLEKDWLDNSFRLTEEEIIEIYQKEGVTLKKYSEQQEEYRRKNRTGLTAEEKLLQLFYGKNEKIEEPSKEMEEPVRKYLNKDLQKKVIEGTLYIVFDSTREWYKFFDGKVSMERIYYVCLEALINSVKYMLHCEKPVFELYVIKSIERNIIKHIAKWEHITYRKAYEIIKGFIDVDYLLENNDKKIDLEFNYDNKEELEKPSKIYYRIKNESYNVDYTKNVSSNNFLKDYMEALQFLEEDEKMIMQLSFDKEGNLGLTNNEISDYLGIESNEIVSIRRKAIKTLRKNKTLNRYREN